MVGASFTQIVSCDWGSTCRSSLCRLHSYEGSLTCTNASHYERVLMLTSIANGKIDQIPGAISDQIPNLNRMLSEKSLFSRSDWRNRSCMTWEEKELDFLLKKSSSHLFAQEPEVLDIRTTQNGHWSGLKGGSLWNQQNGTNGYHMQYY